MNQKKYLESYAQQRGYTNCRHYTDDGWSGGNFERPAWKQLVADIEAGKVAHVIVKDMSRAGRDYLQTGFYTEVLLSQKDAIARLRAIAALETITTRKYMTFLTASMLMIFWRTTMAS